MSNNPTTRHPRHTGNSSIRCLRIVARASATRSVARTRLGEQVITSAIGRGARRALPGRRLDQPEQVAVREEADQPARLVRDGRRSRAARAARSTAA